MSKLLLFDKSLKIDTIINIVKILLILFVALYLIGNFNPFYEGVDAYSYAVAAKQMAGGTFFYSNDLLEIFGKSEFVPEDYSLTNDEKTAIPAGYPGFFGLSIISYLIAGDYAFFYLGPISGIIFLIVSERISTRFFGKYVGLLTLLFLSTNHYLFRTSLNFQTEALGTTFFLIGCFFLINFFKSNKVLCIFAASSFLVLSTHIRTNAIIYFPVEIVCIVIFFLVIKFRPKFIQNDFQENNSQTTLKFFRLSKQQYIKILIIAILPWLSFFLFWFSFYYYFFDDPFTSHIEIEIGSEGDILFLLYQLDSKNFENMKEYSKYFLPYQFPRVVDLSPENFNNINNILGPNWLGIFAILFLGLANIVGFKTKDKRLQIIIFSAMILVTAWFFSSITSESRAMRDVPGRYMYPAFTLYYMILGFIIYKLVIFLKHNINRKISISTRTGLFSLLILFFVFAYSFSPPIQAISEGEFQFKNPIEYSENYTPNKEFFSSNDVLVTFDSHKAIDHGMIPFKSYWDGKTISENSLNRLLRIDEMEYNIYILKDPHWKDTVIYEDLMKKGNVTFTDFSESFCKVNFPNPEKKHEQIQTDSNCL